MPLSKGNKRFEVPLTLEQYEVLQEAAKAAGYTSEADYVRDVLAGKIPPPEGFKNEGIQRGKYPRKTQR